MSPDGKFDGFIGFFTQFFFSSPLLDAIMMSIDFPCPRGALHGGCSALKHRKKWSHLIYAAILPAYLALFFLAERLVVDHYWVSYLPLDDKIPFCEWFALPYVAWYPYLVIPGLIFLLRDGEAFRRYMLYIGLGFSSAVLFCLIFPNGQDLRPATFPRENFCTEILRWIYSADTNTNVCPSMHVIGCWGTVLAEHYALPKQRRGWMIPIAALALLICASTVFVKQHSILDIFVAVPWSLVCGWIIYRPRPAKRPSRSV